MTTYRTIIMSEDQTAAYDSGDDQIGHALMSELRAEAAKLIAGGATHVEIHTEDGIVADAIDA